MTNDRQSRKLLTIFVLPAGALFAAALVLMFVLPPIARGQSPTPTPTPVSKPTATPTPVQTAASTPTPTPTPKCRMTMSDLTVAGIEEYDHRDDGQSAKSGSTEGAKSAPTSTPTSTPTPEVALFHTIRVKVNGLQDWLGQQCSEYSDFILYVDGNGFKGMKPKVSLVDGDKLQFDLRRNSDSQENKDAWTAILSRRPRTWQHDDVPITVGLANGQQVKSSAKATLTVINFIGFVIFVISFLAAIFLFWWLANISDIIRDAGPQPEGFDKRGKPNRKRYSLARTQMAFWFFIIAASYVFIWMVTSDLTGPTAGVLGLMGISAATGLGAAVIDSGKRSSKEGEREALEQKKRNDEADAEKLKSEIAALQASVNAAIPPADLEQQKATLAAKTIELAAKQKEIAETADDIQEATDATKQKPSQGFLDDILSDDDGISFHRFQIAAWTVVLIFVFIAKVYNDLSMPEFDGTLLALMGISGGTYIGFKLPDKQG